MRHGGDWQRIRPVFAGRVVAGFDIFPTGIKVSDEDMGALSIIRDPFHGEWNYTNQPQ